MENKNKLLQEIHKNAEMGEGALNHLIDTVKDSNTKQNKDILDDLRGQIRGYNGFKTKADEMMKQRGEKAEQTSKFENASASLGVKINLLIDSTPSHMAEMIIEGSNMGILDMTKTINQYKNDVDIETKSLADGIIQFEQNNIEALKKYL